MIHSKIKLYISSVLMTLVLIQCSTTDPDISFDDPKELSATQLVAPGNGASNQSASVELSWKTTTDAKEYNIQISENADFDSTVVNEMTEKKAYSATLTVGTTYYWKIRALRNSNEGPWSDQWEFSTAAVEQEPVTIELISPANETEENPAEIYFEWEEAKGGEEYHFQISEDENFDETEIDSVVDSNTLVLPELEGEKEYYWRVSPILDSETGAWSVNFSFSTQFDETGEVQPAPPATNSDEFVSVQNSDFVVNGEVYRYAGTNAYHLPNYMKIDRRVVDRAFDSFEEAGVTVVRTWGFYDGAPQYNGDISLQPKAGEYSEENLRLFDEMIAKGKEKNVRFIIALTNYWSQLGGICQYNEWAGESGCNLSGDAMRVFMNGSKQQELYRDYIEMLLNRVNTVTGVAYKDEPAIFAWEIMNEGRNRGADPTEIRDWYQDIARFIKSIDGNHLVTTGEEGFDDGAPSDYTKDQYDNNYVLRADEGTSYVLNVAIPEIDFGTAHWYPGEWGYHIEKWGTDPVKDLSLIKAQHAWLDDHARIAENQGKPFVMGEYGFPGWGDERVEAVYEDFWDYAEEIKLDGSLLWQFTADNTKCSEYGGNICYPGGRKDQVLYDGFVDHIKAVDAIK